MKIKGALAFIVILSLFALYSCTKNNGEDNGEQIGMSLKHDGTYWHVSKALADKQIDRITITGEDDNGNECEIVLWNVWGPETFTLGGNPNINIGNARWTVGPGSGLTYKTNDEHGYGHCILTELNANTAVGTFEFYGSNDIGVGISISEGKFTALIQ